MTLPYLCPPLQLVTFQVWFNPAVFFVPFVFVWPAGVPELHIPAPIGAGVPPGVSVVAQFFLDPDPGPGAFRSSNAVQSRLSLP